MTNPAVSTSSLTIGLDLGDRSSQLYALDGSRRVVERKRIACRREALVSEFGGRPVASIVVEAGPQSLWVSHLLRELGREVMVVDPRRIRVIA